MRTLPQPAVDWYRRRRAVRRFLKSLGVELYDRAIRIDEGDDTGFVASRIPGLHERIAQDALARTDLILQRIDRRVEGVSTRHGAQIGELRTELETLSAEVEALRERIRAMDGLSKVTSAE